MPEQTFNYTGAAVNFTVPSWVTSMQVEVAGAQGGATTAGPNGGAGGYVLVNTLSVNPNDVLTIVVGGRNGFNGGGGAGPPGAGAVAGAGGGGRSDIRMSNGSLVIVIAGGGGGSGGGIGASQNGGDGGGGGGTIGVTGGSPNLLPPAGFVAGGGGGGTQTFGGGGGSVGAGGIGGIGGSGALAAGGNGGSGTLLSGAAGGGGGGGGYYGGGGGGAGGGAGAISGAGGGGGSSWVHFVGSGVVHAQSARLGDGYVRLIWGSPQDTAPTAITPASGSIVTTNTPTLGATIVAQGTARQRVVWHLSTSSDFVANLKIITEPTSDLKVSGATTQPVPLADKLFQGTWYIRAHTLDEGNVASPYSSTQQFTVAHAPSAAPVSPSSGQTVAFNQFGLTVSWLFSDPSPDDTQSAYQVIVTDASTNATVEDTGKVVSLSKTANVVIPETSKNATLSWRVRVWDQDNVAGNYTNAVTFTVGDAPGIAVATMTTVTTSSPTISFTFTPIVAPLATYRVTITRDSDSALVYDSGWVSE